jgi:hypothetical protein
MNPIDIIVIAVIVLVIGGASAYIIKAKKSGKKCIGCPNSAVCSSGQTEGGCSGSCEHCSSCCGERK